MTEKYITIIDMQTALDLLAEKINSKYSSYSYKSKAEYLNGMFKITTTESDNTDASAMAECLSDEDVASLVGGLNAG